MFVASIISAVQDLVTAVLPTFLFWNLRIPLQQKVVLFGIFAIGYGVVALGCLRAYYSWQIYYGTYDVTWVTWDLFLVSMLELHVGCFCANAPTFKVFFKHFFHEKLTSGFEKSNGSRPKGQGNSSGYSGARSGRSSASISEKITVFFSKGSLYSKHGYISEPHTGVSVDRHGGVLVQKQIQVAHSLSPAVAILSERLGIWVKRCLIAGLRSGDRALLSALWYVPSSNRFQSHFCDVSSCYTLMSITVLMGRWSESWSRSRSTWLLITRSTRPAVTRQRSVVVREVLSSYVMAPGGRVLSRLKSSMIASRSADSGSVCLTFAPPHMGWCRLKSPSRICSWD
jgi:hypothetical protein